MIPYYATKPAIASNPAIQQSSNPAIQQSSNDVIKLGRHQAIVSAILAGDGPGAFAACQQLLAEND